MLLILFLLLSLNKIHAAEQSENTKIKTELVVIGQNLRDDILTPPPLLLIPNDPAIIYLITKQALLTEASRIENPVEAVCLYSQVIINSALDVCFEQIDKPGAALEKLWNSYKNGEKEKINYDFNQKSSALFLKCIHEEWSQIQKKINKKYWKDIKIQTFRYLLKKGLVIKKAPKKDSQ